MIFVLVSAWYRFESTLPKFNSKISNQRRTPTVLSIKFWLSFGVKELLRQESLFNNFYLPIFRLTWLFQYLHLLLEWLNLIVPIFLFIFTLTNGCNLICGLRHVNSMSILLVIVKLIFLCFHSNISKAIHNFSVRRSFIFLVLILNAILFTVNLIDVRKLCLNLATKQRKVGIVLISVRLNSPSQFWWTIYDVNIVIFPIFILIYQCLSTNWASRWLFLVGYETFTYSIFAIPCNPSKHSPFSDLYLALVVHVSHHTYDLVR